MAQQRCLSPRHAQCQITLTPAATPAAAESGGWCVHWWHNRHTRRPDVRCRGRRRPDAYRAHRAESRTWCISWADAPLVGAVAVEAGRKAVDPSCRAPMPPMRRALGRGERPEGHGAPSAAGGMDAQSGSLGRGGAPPGRRGEGGRQACLGQRAPALAGQTPAAGMSRPRAQQHMDVLRSRATVSGMSGNLFGREV
jgi:hypothetical protein